MHIYKYLSYINTRMYACMSVSFRVVDSYMNSWIQFNFICWRKFPYEEIFMNTLIYIQYKYILYGIYICVLYINVCMYVISILYANVCVLIRELLYFQPKGKMEYKKIFACRRSCRRAYFEGIPDVEAATMIYK